MLPKRSTSPTFSRPNPNSRSNNLDKKGFNGYPFAKSSSGFHQKGFVSTTPVNSPAEYARSSDGRLSGGASFRDHEQKENERDYNTKPAVRTKSPSINTKGTKNFMSPTISAASKINPSPKKKVLGERNEAIRTSASLSDGKFHFFSTKSLDFDHENEVCNSEPENGSSLTLGEVKNEAFEADLVVLSPEVPTNTAKSCESLPLSEMPKMDSDSKSAVISSPCTQTPLDIDPYPPPYDPKNNYLSPRPQFRHYNPNWRNESYANQGMNLEDDFTTESVSDVENSSEDVQSEDSLQDQVDDASSSFSSSSVAELPPLSEAKPPETQQCIEIAAKLEPKRSCWFTNWKFVAKLLIFSVGLMSIILTCYPGVGNVIYRDEIISHVYNNPHTAPLVGSFNRIIQNAKFWSAYSVDIGKVVYQDEIISRVYNNPYAAAWIENFNGIVQNYKIWSASYVDYLSQMIHNVRGVDKFSALTFGNLTAWHEDEEDWGYMVQEFGMDPYFDSIKEIQGYCELQNDQTIEIYEFNDEASIQMQSYPTPEDTDVISTEDEQVVKLDDSQPQQAVNQTYEFKEAFVQIHKDTDGSSSEDDESLNLDDSQSEDVNHGVQDEISGQMQSYSAPEDKESSTEEVDLIKAVDSEPEEEENFAFEGNHAVMAEQALFLDEEAELIESADSEPVMEESFAIEDNDPVMAEQALSTDEPENMECAMGVVGEINIPEPQSDVTTSNEPSQNDDNSPANDEQPVEKEINSSEANQYMKSSDKSLAPIPIAITLVTLSLVAALMYYMKPKKDSPLADQAIAEKEHSVHDAPSSCSGPVAVDMVGDSCPSEMSSFRNSTYTKSKQREGDEEAYSQQKSAKRNYKRESFASSSSEHTMDDSCPSEMSSFRNSTYTKSKQKEGDEEAYSQQKSAKRNYKRESFASSSSEHTMDSCYGSFSTYSIIQPKHGDREVATPVRRSSRIRSKVTSP